MTPCARTGWISSSSSATRGEERGEGGKERVGKGGVGRRGWERGGEEWEWMIVGLVREELN